MTVGITNLVTQAKKLLATIRFQAFDTTTPEGRAKERHRRIALTALAAAAAKAITILTTLISIPLTVGYLGVERYGMWATISSFVALLAFADLGLGNGLLNAISEANGRDDRELASRHVSSAFFSLAGMALAMGLAFALAYPFISWGRVFNVSSLEAVAEAGPAVIVFVACFLVNMPLGIVQRVQLGYQEGFANSIWIGAGNILALIGVLVVIYLRLGLPWLVLALVGAPVLAGFLNGVVLFGLRRPWLRPSRHAVARDSITKIFRLGLLFFVLQLAVAMAYTSDNIVITQFLGPEAVTQYSVPYRMFTLAPMVLGMVIGPLWPAYGEAITRADMRWVKRTLGQSLKMTTIIVGIPSLVLVAFGKPLLHLWVGTEITPPFALLLGFGVWSLLSALGNAVAMFLNGASVIRFQVVFALLMAFSALLAKIFLVGRLGLPGVIWATIVAYFVFTVVPVAVYVPRLLARMHVEPSENAVA